MSKFIENVTGDVVANNYYKLQTKMQRNER